MCAVCTEKIGATRSGVVFNKWTETVLVDLEMAGGDCAECLVLMWLIVIRGRSLSETLTDTLLSKLWFYSYRGMDPNMAYIDISYH